MKRVAPTGFVQTKLKAESFAGDQALAGGNGFAAQGPGRSLPPGVQESMESQFDADLSGVRVHDDSSAHVAAGALKARAFTSGRDVVFASGEFRPGTTTGDRLIAHELAHVVQQRNGGAGRASVGVSSAHDPAEGRADAAADAIVSGRPVPNVGSAGEATIHRAPVASYGGSFDTTTYAAVSAPSGAVGDGLGADIVLEFTANDLVESTKIGMIQSVKALKSSRAGGARTTVATGVGDPEEGQLIMGAGQADPGREIDRSVHPGGRAQPNTSPIYGVHNSPAIPAVPAVPATPAVPASPGIPAVPATPGSPAVPGTPASVATALGHGTPTTGTSQWGSHTKDPATGAFLPAVPARIDDQPRRGIEFVGQTYEHTFESAAIAIEGPIPANTYLGSVSWGWRSDAAGTVSVDPLTLVQAGAPSAAFMGAAARWNAATFHDTGSGAAVTPVGIPATSFTSGTTLPSARSTSDLVIQIARLNAELVSMVAGTDKTNKEFEKRVFEAELAGRANQPTLSLADQERAAALLSTPDLLRRSDAMPAEISLLPTSSARTDKELEQEAVRREIAKRRLLITVHVHDTEDIIGSDSVYVTALAGTRSSRTSVVNLNDGQEHTFVVPLSALFTGPPSSLASGSLFIKAFDEDWEGDDLMFDKEWIWSSLPAEETQSRDGGRYTVRIDFAQIR